MMQAIVSRRGFRDRWILGWVFKDGREQGEQRIFQRENSGNKGSCGGVGLERRSWRVRFKRWW